jgi:ATP-dependent Clp protease protease subunit
MSRANLPQIQNFDALESLEPRRSELAEERFNAALRIQNAAPGAETVIDIMGYIGRNPFTGEGVDSQVVSALLKTAKNVVVNLNSPGGSFFQGTAIYNLLAQHPHEVIVNVLGLAGSAASIIAMAGDKILMAPASFIMIHNASASADGDRHDFADVVETLTSIDYAIRDLYVARTGKQANKISAMMDSETWMNAKDAITQKFADGMVDGKVVEDPEVKNIANPLAARREIEALLSKGGMSRSRQRELLNVVKAGPGPIDRRHEKQDSGIGAIREDLRALATASKPGAADTPITPRADLSASLDRLADSLPG